MAGQITVSGLSAGESAGQRILGPVTMVGKAVIGETLVIPLTTGDNTIAVPINSIAVLIIPPTASEIAIKIRTNKNSGDAGLPINEGPFPFVYTFPATIPTSLIINAASGTQPVTLAFI